jgi:hypothetical protein
MKLFMPVFWSSVAKRGEVPPAGTSGSGIFFDFRRRPSRPGASCLVWGSPGGYLHVTLWRSNQPQSVDVHVLVARAFHGPGKPGQQVRHLDGDQLNNAATDLAWGTPKEDTEDKRQHGTLRRGERCYQAKLTEADVREIRALYTPAN